MTRRHRALHSLDEEIRAHIELLTQEYIDRGMAPDEARRRALLRFGDVQLVKEDTRAVWAWRLLDELRTTVRIAARTWRRTPALAAAIVVTLALGIGATTTAFTMAYSLIVKSFPFPDAERLVWITSYDSRAAAGPPVIGSNRLPQFARWQQDPQSFEQLGAWAGSAPDAFTVTGETPERIRGLRVTHQLLPMLGARPAFGQLFGGDDDAPGAAQTVVLSDGYWRRRFAGRTDVLGESVIIENRPHTVVGVVAPSFQLSGSLFSGAPIDVYLPLTVDGSQDLGGFMAVIGRLRPGVTAEAARTELASRQSTLPAGKWPWVPVIAQKLIPLKDLTTRSARSPVLLLFGAFGCVLLMACANLANLLLVRASARRREFQVRTALGASAARVLRQMLVETGMLVVAGGIAGVTLSMAIIDVLRRLTWLSLPRIGEMQVEWPAFAFAATVCAVITIGFGSIGLCHTQRRNLVEGLRPHGGNTMDWRAVYTQRLALSTQVAAVIVLSMAGGLLLRSMAKLISVDPGFDPRGVMAMRVDPASRLPAAARLPFFPRVLETVAAVPGVQSAALTIHVPMGDRPSMGWDAIPAEGTAIPTEHGAAAGRIVSPGYFRTVGIAIVEGRDFESRDIRTSPFVMAINETFANRVRAAGVDPLLARFQTLGGIRQVVAVVRDVKHRGLDADSGREVYIPMAQAPTFFQSYDLVVRAADPMALAPSIRTAIQTVDRQQAFGSPVTLEQNITRTVRPRQLMTGVIGGFAAITLLLAICGVYGVVGYRVAQRRKDIAIRLALGAPGRRVIAGVLADTMTCLGFGLAAGVMLSLAAASLIRSYLFGIEPTDAATLVAACATVAGAAVIAAYLPARRAPRIDPTTALRVD